MMKKVYVYLAKGFEEVEAITPIDMLRRAGAEVVTLAVGDSLEVEGAHGISVKADALCDKTDITDAEMIVLPGGFPGYENLGASEKVDSDIKYMISKDKYIAAICGTPAAVLGPRGYLKNRRATCYPGMEEDLACKRIHAGAVCVDGNIITSKSAGTAMAFSIVLVRELLGDTAANKLQRAIVLDV